MSTLNARRRPHSRSCLGGSASTRYFRRSRASVDSMPSPFLLRLRVSSASALNTSILLPPFSRNSKPVLPIPTPASSRAPFSIETSRRYASYICPESSPTCLRLLGIRAKPAHSILQPAYWWHYNPTLMGVLHSTLPVMQIFHLSDFRKLCGGWCLHTRKTLRSSSGKVLDAVVRGSPSKKPLHYIHTKLV